MNHELNELRIKIDEIDQQMKKLFFERLALVKQVGIYKKQHQLPVFDPDRELAMLEKHRQQINDEALFHFYKKFLQNLMDISKEAQQ
jgi:monofunctional chorismate mutase